MATEKSTASSNPHNPLAIAHLAIRQASSLLGYAIAAERDRDNTDLADTLFIADERLVDALDRLDELDGLLQAMKAGEQ